jgi:DNA-directed RNA polymerase specialized sigma54-like protein
VSIDEAVRDVKARQEAIDTYQGEQSKLFEAQWARKAEENLQIQAELETVKTRYMERVRRNLDDVARAKATFGNWLTMKQQEAQSMAEAVELCVKAPGADVSSGSMAEVSLIDASAKPV